MGQRAAFLLAGDLARATDLPRTAFAATHLVGCIALVAHGAFCSVDLDQVEVGRIVAALHAVGTGPRC